SAGMYLPCPLYGRSALIILAGADGSRGNQRLEKNASAFFDNVQGILFRVPRDLTERAEYFHAVRFFP
ncbi:MAG: hypothetical protein LUQ19_04705, partial [Methanoregula sp.]|nr:hypothetical protein [Methanoregula sp.]